jgi:2-polyprenyl-3-methyl-5-hydroxy-6-metoxy-1,4-benzoquinol methylase
MIGPMTEEEQTQPVLLLLVDISGYTRFMVSHAKELRHSQTIITELLTSLMHQVDVPLQISAIEGDALFLYAIKSADEAIWRRRSSSLVSRLLGLFQVFGERLAEIGAYSVCRCAACSEVGDLKLKIIVHSGEALLTRVGGFPTLSGVDVITLHRLAKNSVSENQYVLMTEAAFHDLDLPPGAVVREGSEEYDTGRIKTFIYLPEVHVVMNEDLIRRRFSSDNAAVKILRDEISREYKSVAEEPARGYHFNTGLAALAMNEYEEEWLAGIPDSALASFSGMGNPFLMGIPGDGEYVVDIGSGAGVDSIVAARAVGPSGHVIGVDMTDEMLEKAGAARTALGLDQLEFRRGYMEDLPVTDGWADLVISNGAVNLSPTKDRVFQEIFRVLRPGGRIQIADITVDKEIPEGAKRDIDLWTN